jgi:hypothetical protein
MFFSPLSLVVGRTVSLGEVVKTFSFLPLRSCLGKEIVVKSRAKTVGRRTG